TADRPVGQLYSGGGPGEVIIEIDAQPPLVEHCHRRLPSAGGVDIELVRGSPLLPRACRLRDIDVWAAGYPWSADLSRRRFAGSDIGYLRWRDARALTRGVAMKAVTWHGTEDVRVEEVPDPIIVEP